ncbi:MAG: endonuclease/exonuclease/phosphatase family protein [Myxococcales bacterium]|jgi:endonuclease/exonuclease/phosphatase family metal-dependent hydrolase|nr:endonuclease/exonuclease/phosphatase family protein [Myxococcales bacterium]
MTLPIPKVLRIASWNIQAGCRGIVGIANGIEALHADLIALQEVERGTALSGGIDQAEFLARTAGFEHHLFVPTLRRDGGDYGLALLSRYPLKALPAMPLPVPLGAEPRVLGLAEMRLGAAGDWSWPLTLAFTHLTHRPDRARARLFQARAIVERLRGEPHCLLLGDFNGRAGTAMHRTITTAFRDMFTEAGQGRGGTHAPLGPFFPALRIDYLFASDSLRALDAQVVRSQASDHHALVGRVGLEGMAAEIGAQPAERSIAVKDSA